MFLQRKHLCAMAGAAVLSTMGVVALLSMRHKTLTWDEPTHYSFGARLLRDKKQTRVTLSSMAINQLNVVPNFYLRGDRAELPSSARAVFAARMVTVLAGVLLGGFLFLFARRLYGDWAALGTVAVYSVSPTVLAHTRWVTNDIYCALFVTATLYFFYLFMKHRRLHTLIFAALSCGLAQVSKFSAVLLFPVLGLLWLAERRRWSGCRFAAKDEEPVKRLRWQKWAGPMSRLLLFGTLVWVVWNGAYYFQDTTRSWRSYRFRSRFMKRVGAMLGPVPAGLPSPYLDALDITFDINAKHAGRGNIYVLGKTSRRGFWYYFLVALAYKVPLAVWVLCLVGLFFGACRPRLRFSSRLCPRWGPPRFAAKELYLIFPMGAFLIYFVFFCTAQIGVRYLMPFLVLLFVFVGRVWALPASIEDVPSTGPARAIPWRRLYLGATGACVLWMAMVSLSYFPHFLSFFNGLVPEKKMAYTILADSNLDWKQNRKVVRRFMQKHNIPAFRLHPAFPAVGRWIVSANELVGVGHPAKYRWLRRLEPTRHLFYSHLIFDVSKRDLHRALTIDLSRPLKPIAAKPAPTWRRGLFREDFANKTLTDPACRKQIVGRLGGKKRICGRPNDFSMRYTGYLHIPQNGDYVFSLGSDDGSRLFLNDRLLLSLWSDHSLVHDHGLVHLEAGVYRFQVDFYESWGDARLAVYGRPFSAVIRSTTGRTQNARWLSRHLYTAGWNQR